MEDFLSRALAGLAHVEAHPVFQVIRVNLPDGLLLLRVEIQLLYRHLWIDTA